MCTLLLGFNFESFDDVVNIVIMEAFVVHDRLVALADPIKTKSRWRIVSIFVESTFTWVQMESIKKWLLWRSFA